MSCMVGARLGDDVIVPAAVSLCLSDAVRRYLGTVSRDTELSKL